VGASVAFALADGALSVEAMVATEGAVGSAVGSGEVATLEDPAQPARINETMRA
jgi:hypothetical protein